VEQLLRTRRAELTDKISSLVETMARSPAHGIATTGQTEIGTIHLDRLTRQLANVEAALSRLSRGDYGLCDTCGQFIGLDRLKELPFTRECRPCRTVSQGILISPSQFPAPRRVAQLPRISSR
jgi:RNA polymerase-binding transcription factor DksA